MNPGRRRAWSLSLLAALGAAALSAQRVPLGGRSHAVLVAKAELHAVLAFDPMVTATLSSPYSRSAATLGRALAALERAGLPVDHSARVLLFILWLGCAAAVFHLTLGVTGSETAGILAALWYGLQAPFSPGAVPNGLSALDRSLGLLPLLLAVENCLLGRRNAALAFLIAATYLHANPAIHLWSWIVAEDLLEAVRRPAFRRGANLRLLATGLAAMPLLLAAGRSPLGESDPAYARAALASFQPFISGRGLAVTDLLFGLFGLTLALGALWRARDWDMRAPLLRAMGWMMLTLAVGTVVGGYGGPGGPLWGIVVKMQPWVSLYILDLVGILALSRELALAMEQRRPLAPALAWTLALAAPRDLGARALSLPLWTSLHGGPWQKTAKAAAGAALSAGLLAAAFPGAARALAVAVGLRGGFLSLPTFQWTGAVGLLGALLLGRLLSMTPPRYALRAGLAMTVGLFALSVALWPGTREDQDLSRMALWARRALPLDAVIFQAPLAQADCTLWMARAERLMSPCVEDADGPMLYFSAAPAMGRRLLQSGYNPEAVTDYGSHIRQMVATLERATPERVARLAAERGITHVLIPADKPWPGNPIAVHGKWAMYEARK
ncbi:MAG TPA: hypothetical protein DCZ01_04205 [Elusimicrobia bacterium]|nr:MAG: hypothetical protein A2X37_12320 [Elusimicrobia bacterium GWA2_66_18]OGR73651.1 MAG: hypothetical protein A2X40_07920 [Elusimicrobia bacterium GWC2_65_9]HAZ07727.1 hypothetical protein [Elusimicrobiota bacterium]